MARVGLSCCYCRAFHEHMRRCACQTVAYCSKECQKKHWKEHKPLCDRGKGTSVSASGDPLITTSMCEQAVAFVNEQTELKNLDVYAPVIVLFPPRGRSHEPLRLTSLGELVAQNPTMQEPMKKLLKQVVDEQHRWIIHLLWFTDNKVLHKIIRGRFAAVEELQAFSVEVCFIEERQEQATWQEKVWCESPAFQALLSDGKLVPPRGRVEVRLCRGDNVMRGTLEYSTKTLHVSLTSPSGASTRSKGPESIYDTQEFQMFPQEKLIKMYVGDRVVHLLLLKVSQPLHLRQDQRGRLLLYACRSVRLIRRQQAELSDLPKQCLVCCMKSKLKCPQCGVYYCSRKCQKEDWKNHKHSHH